MNTASIVIDRSKVRRAQSNMIHPIILIMQLEKIKNLFFGGKQGQDAENCFQRKWQMQ